MGFYRDRVLPAVIDQAMRQAALAPYRARVAPLAEGRILEIGVGSGHNLPLYGDRAEEVIGLEPSAGLLGRARAGAGRAVRPVRLMEGSAEAIPLDRASVDTVVSTWTLCSIENAARALSEVRRVLRPGGRLLFVEHGRSPDRGVVRWQNRLNPAWKVIGGGCNLNRPIDEMIAVAGFEIERLETGYASGPRLMTFMYEGVARPA